MSGTLDTRDIIVFLIYFIVVSGYGYWIYQRKKALPPIPKTFF
nr:hypothetical protein [Haliscomenobacter sp.]